MQNPGGGMGPNETRNVILAIVLSVAIFAGFEFLYNGPARERLQEQQRAQAELQQAQQPAATPGEGTDGADGANASTESQTVSRTQALGAATSRVAIDTSEVDGSISLQGARIDDLSLRQYRETIEPDSPEVTLLSPINTQYGHDAFFGWEVQNGDATAALSDARSQWTAAEGSRLTSTTPVTLRLDAADGRTIERTIAIDEHFMFTITDVVRNESGAPISVRPFGTVRRDGLPEHYKNLPIVHQGMIGAVGPNNNPRQDGFQAADKHARDRVRERVGEDERLRDFTVQGGWLGITEHYWLTAIIPDQNERISGYFDARTIDNRNDYLASYRGQWREIPAGGEVTYTQRLFAGAKRYELIRDYQAGGEAAGGGAPIVRFDHAIDWGNFWFLTRPFFALLHWFGQTFAGWGVVFNFGLAILASTVVIKMLMFPLVYQSFKSMAKMRGLQPKMKEVQERYAADKQRQQQEILKLYQTEKINPVAGCVPILLQIPVFYALYKTLTVTIEMRHAPFVGWIHDLSARDPTSLFNLFGLLPFDVSGILGGALVIGAWPILYGVSMLALQALSPPPTDPIQAQIFRFLPVVFAVMFAAFPAGLVTYWTWSNTLSILQQYVIMRRQGVETQLDKWLKKRFDRDDDSGGGAHKRQAATAK